MAHGLDSAPAPGTVHSGRHSQRPALGIDDARAHILNDQTRETGMTHAGDQPPQHGRAH